MTADRLECVYVSRDVRLQATYSHLEEVFAARPNLALSLQDIASRLLTRFARVHFCSSASQVEDLLRQRSYSNPAPTFILVSINAEYAHDEYIVSNAAAAHGKAKADEGAFLRRHSKSADELVGFELLRYINLTRQFRKLKRVLTAACLRNVDPSNIMRTFDVGSDDFLHLQPDSIEIDRLAWTLIRNTRGWRILPQLSDELDPETYENDDVAPTRTQWHALQTRMHSRFLHYESSDEMLPDKYMPPQEFPSEMLHFSSYLNNSAFQARTPGIKRLVSSWSFSTLDLSEIELMHSAAVMFKHILALPGAEAWQISDHDLFTLIDDIRSMYCADNPYHNFRHAVDVMQAVFFMLLSAEMLPPLSEDCPVYLCIDCPVLKKIASPQHMLGACIVGLGHDVGHPGVNNAFLVSNKSPLAVCYNDRSVLENLHCAALSRKLSQSWPSTQQPGMRKIIMELILSTDMALHFDYMSKFKDLEKTCQETRALAAADTSNTAAPVDISPETMEKYRLTLFSALVKCGDISNVARPFTISRHWSNVLLQEFFNQAHLEQSLGLPVTKIFDPEHTRQSASQVFFINMFAIPLFASLDRIMPNLQPISDIIISNRDTWQQGGIPKEELLYPVSEPSPTKIVFPRPSVSPTDQKIPASGMERASSPTKANAASKQFRCIPNFFRKKSKEPKTFGS